MRDQLIEHLKFAAELGVAGVSKDPAWRTRLHGAADSRQTHADDGALESEPVMFLTRETLADIKADIGDDCRRCAIGHLEEFFMALAGLNANKYPSAVVSATRTIAKRNGVRVSCKA